MKIIDRYITKELVGPFIFGIAAFTSIVAGSSVLYPLISKSISHGISIVNTLKIFIYKIPGILTLTLPMSILLATIVCISRLSNDREITAFRAAGVSLYRMIVPVVFMGLIISMVNILFNEFIVPKANYSSELLYESLKSAIPKIQKNVNLTEYDSNQLPLRIINVLEMDGNNLNDVTIAEYEKGRLSRVIRAEKGKWQKTGGWEFYRGLMHSFNPNDKQKVLVIEFEKEYIDINIDLDVAKTKKNAEQMSARELKKLINFKKRTGSDINKDLLHYHIKFSLPFACLIFSIIGVCVGLKPHKRSSAMGLGLSIVIIMVYYVLFSVGMGLCLLKVLPPILAAWLPNAIVGLIGLVILQRLAN